jgi:hypothetical protein
MDLIIAIFMYLGLLNPGQTPSNVQIENNLDSIEQYKQDQGFLQYYESSRSGIVVLDTQEWH